MKHLIFLWPLLFSTIALAQQHNESNGVYKKRVLESTEVDFLNSYYTQTGDNASVSGGIGTEKITDITPTIVVAIPLGADNVLTIDAGISTYTSASSSNLNPFDASGASRRGEDEEDEDEHEDEDEWEDNFEKNTGAVTGSPWLASSGASYKDTWSGMHVDYSHHSDDRNKIWNVGFSVASEYDYFSWGFGGGFSKLFNDKNTEIGIKGQVYLDTWHPKYPTELDSYIEAKKNLNAGFFSGIDILNQNGDVVDKSGNNGSVWSPVQHFELIKNKERNSYSVSFSFSQIVSKNMQISVFFDLVRQEGWLSNPMQRVYFADRENYYIGDPTYINIYTSPKNIGVFQLADDIESLPKSRLKVPVGARANYYLNEKVVIRTYYRYYYDDWGVRSNTAKVELPIKIIERLTVIPSYRFYNQISADYFAPFEKHLSTQKFYTSDYDLASFYAHQYGVGINYTDIFTSIKIGSFGLKSIDLKFQNYYRSTGLKSIIISGGVKFVAN